MPLKSVRSLLAGLALAMLCACASSKGCVSSTDRYDRQMLAAALEDPQSTAGLLLGDFALAPNGVVDGDTIKVGGLDASLRLLAIDTEETFKSQADWNAYDDGWDAYLQKKQAKTERPIKSATPMGMEAKIFAQKFFRGVKKVRLERDHPKEIKGAYGRYLTYVFVERDGQWVNYNVEVVRAGMSPYFTKYGYSRRFHDAFVAAQEEARTAQRGIWDPAKEHYPDYDLRLRWWNARAEFIAEFEREAEQRDDYIVLTHWDALQRLEQAEGREITLLAAVGSLAPREGAKPARAMLTRRMFSSVPLVFFDDRVFRASEIQRAEGEFVRVRGTVTTYTFKHKRRGGRSNEQLQIVVRQPRQVQISRAYIAAKGVAGGLAEPPPNPPDSAPPPESAPPVVQPSPPAPVDPPGAPLLEPPAPPEPSAPPEPTQQPVVPPVQPDPVQPDQG